MSQSSPAPIVSSRSMSTLASLLHSLCDSQPFITRFTLINCITGERISRHGDIATPSASVRKISILLAALSSVHAGQLNLNQSVTVLSQHQVKPHHSGLLHYFQTPFQCTLKDLLYGMIIISDNTSTGLVCELVGLNRLQSYCESVGLTRTVHKYGLPPDTMDASIVPNLTTTSADDTALLLELLTRSVINHDESALNKLKLSYELAQLAMNILGNQKLKLRLPALLPMKTSVAHKTGTQGGCYNDSGIIFADSHHSQPLFILSVFTAGVPPEIKDSTSLVSQNLTLFESIPANGYASRFVAILSRLSYDSCLIDYQQRKQREGTGQNNNDQQKKLNSKL